MHPCIYGLTHWGRVTHICVSKLTIIGSDNGLSPGRRQAIIWTNAGILLILKRNSGIFIQDNAFENVVCEIASILSRPQCVKTSHDIVSCTWYWHWHAEISSMHTQHLQLGGQCKPSSCQPIFSVGVDPGALKYHPNMGHSNTLSPVCRWCTLVMWSVLVI